MTGIKYFGGKAYRTYRWFHLKKEAEKEAEELRKQGMLVRIGKRDALSDNPRTGYRKLPGYELYLRSKERDRR